MAASAPSTQPRSGSRARTAALAAIGGVGFAIVLWGGYSNHRRWTGINSADATLWNWLQPLLLPLLLPTVVIPALAPAGHATGLPRRTAMRSAGDSPR